MSANTNDNPMKITEAIKEKPSTNDPEIRRQRYNHTCCVHDDPEQSGTEDLQSYESISVQTSQEPWEGLNYDWYTPFYLQPSYPTEQGTVLINPYQYSYIFLNPLTEDVATLQDLYNQNAWGQQLNGYQLFDAFGVPITSGLNIAQYDVGDEADYDDELLTHNAPLQIPQGTGPVITPCGTIAILLRHCVRVDITVDKAIYLSNFPGRCIAAMNAIGDKSCIMHPSGKMLQDGINVHMETGNRLAKISRRGITFTSLEHSLAYLVDASGTKSTTERFRNLQHDFSLEVFYTSSFYGQHAYDECLLALACATHRFYENGDEVWTIGGVRIKQNQWGDVRVSRNYGRRVLRTSPTIGTVSASTPFIHMAAGCDPDRYFFVRRGEKRLSAHIGGFSVRNGSQKAGFDKNGRLVLY